MWILLNGTRVKVTAHWVSVEYGPPFIRARLRHQVTWNVEANNPFLGSWVGVHTVIYVVSLLIGLNSYGPFALERRFWWDFNAKRWLSSQMARSRSSKRAAESCLVFIGRELSHQNLPPCSLHAMQWGRRCVGRCFLSAESDHRIPRIHAASPLHVIRGWKYIGFCHAFHTGSELSLPAINDH